MVEDGAGEGGWVEGLGVLIVLHTTWERGQGGQFSGFQSLQRQGPPPPPPPPPLPLPPSLSQVDTLR